METTVGRQAARHQEERSALPQFSVGSGTCGLAAGADKAVALLQRELAARGLEAVVKQVGCVGMCHWEPIVDIRLPGKPRLSFGPCTERNLKRVLHEYVDHGIVPGDLLLGVVVEPGRAHPCPGGPGGPDPAWTGRAGGARAAPPAAGAPHDAPPGADRPEQLRPHRPRQPGRVPRQRRVPGPGEGPHPDDAGAGDRRGLHLRPARPGRRRFPHGEEVGPHPPEPWNGKVHGLQRRRGRPRRLHGPEHLGGRPASGCWKG